jgi:hypothetical protein
LSSCPCSLVREAWAGEVCADCAPIERALKHTERVANGNRARYLERTALGDVPSPEAVYRPRVTTRAVLAAVVRCPDMCGADVDPLSPTVETASAALIRPIVTTLIRRGVSHVAWLFCSQVRAPVAPAAAVMAQATHMRSD